MMKQLYTFLILTVLILILSNCGEQKGSKKKSFTMAVDSELTLLMRDMFTYFEGVKKDIKGGKLLEEIKVFQDVHKAVATSPEKSSSELYQAMASVYVESAKRLNKAGVDKIEAFNNMVSNCMSCHQQMCPGPMVKIKKLYIK